MTPAIENAAIPTMPVDGDQSLNSVLQSEICAELAYGKVADALKARNNESDFVGILRQLQEEHELAAASIRCQLAKTGAPTDATGPMGCWAPAI